MNSAVQKSWKLNFCSYSKACKNCFIVFAVELFDPLNQSSAPGAGGADKGGAGSTSVLEGKPEDGLEEVIKQLEKKVNQLLEESAIANCNGKFQVVRT